MGTVESIFEVAAPGVVAEAHPEYGVAITNNGDAREARRWAEKYAKRMGRKLARRTQRPLNSMSGGYVYSFDYAKEGMK